MALDPTEIVREMQRHQAAAARHLAEAQRLAVLLGVDTTSAPAGAERPPSDPLDFDNDLITVPQAAVLLQCHERTMWDLVKSRPALSIMVGGRRLVYRSRLLDRSSWEQKSAEPFSRSPDGRGASFVGDDNDEDAHDRQRTKNNPSAAG
jgi:hypothetical protein